MVTLHSSQLFTLYKSCDELVTNSSTIQYNEVFLCSIDGCVFPKFLKYEACVKEDLGIFRWVYSNF